MTRKTSSRALRTLVWPLAPWALGGGADSSTCVNVNVFLNSSPQLVSDPTDSHTLEPSFVFFAVLNKRAMPRCVELPGCPSLALASRSQSPHHHRSPRDASTRLRRPLCPIRRVFGAHEDASSVRSRRFVAHDDAHRRRLRRRAFDAHTVCAPGASFTRGSHFVHTGDSFTRGSPAAGSPDEGGNQTQSDAIRGSPAAGSPGPHYHRPPQTPRGTRTCLRPGRPPRSR